jgi:hypothetical protein
LKSIPTAAADGQRNTGRIRARSKGQFNVSRLKNLFTAMVLLAFCAVTVAAAVKVASQPLPETTPERVDLRTWIIERDLSHEPATTRAQVARRFEKEFRRDSPLMLELRRLDPQERQQAQDNIAQLIEPLFVDKANEYFRQPEHRRERYLDRELDRLLKLVDPQRSADLDSVAFSPAGLAAIALFHQHLEQWVERADPEMRPKLRGFATALQNRWFARQTQRAVDES